MRYLFPRCKFADTMTLDNQITQVMMEACEICRASANNEGLDRVVEELFDTYHAMETAFWILPTAAVESDPRRQRGVSGVGGAV